jgi:glutamate racemase
VSRTAASRAASRSTAPAPRRAAHPASAARDLPIGVFDSGIGGLTVVRALRRILPGEAILFFGDTARVPYGPKSAETVRRFALEDAGFLVSKGVKMVVVACNTVSSVALDDLARRVPLPVVGVVEPGARAAAAASRNGRIGVIGTRGTVASGAYPRAIRARRAEARVEQAACPLFVPLVEEGWSDNPVALAVAREYLDPLRRSGIDALVLGCTHYPLLKPVIAEVMGPDVTLVDTAEETAHDVRELLAARGLAAARRGEDRCFVSDIPHRFEEEASKFLGEPLARVERVGVEDLEEVGL